MTTRPIGQQTETHAAQPKGGAAAADISVRPIEAADAFECGRIGFEAHRAVAAAHGFPSEQPSLEFAQNLIRFKVADPNAHGMVAEHEGAVAGSIFLNTFPGTPAAAIGPLTVDPARECGAGRGLLESAVQKAYSLGFDRIRLVQSPAHMRSLALYTKVGFVVREPLVMVQGPARGITAYGGRQVRPALLHDKDGCNHLAEAALGFERDFELEIAIREGTASVAEAEGRITGYTTGIGLRGHAAAETSEDLLALVYAASRFSGPGFFVPARNRRLLAVLFDTGFRGEWPATLMTLGSWQDPTAYLPSIAF